MKEQASLFEPPPFPSDAERIHMCATVAGRKAYVRLVLGLADESVRGPLDAPASPGHVAELRSLLRAPAQPKDEGRALRIRTALAAYKIAP